MWQTTQIAARTMAVKAATRSPKKFGRPVRPLGLTQTQAAHLIYCALGTWQQWELGTRRMHAAFWELWRLKAGLAKGGPT